MLEQPDTTFAELALPLHIESQMTRVALKRLKERATIAMSIDGGLR